MVVLELWGPTVAGVKSYVNVHESFGASGTPAQFWLPPKLSESFGAPPEKFGVCVVLDTFVIVIGRLAVAPT